jgi:polar amino acid transport system permease protein
MQVESASAGLSFVPALQGYDGLLLLGLWRSLVLSFLGFGGGLALGFGLVALRGLGPRFSAAVGVYTTILRALPETILIMLLYYVCSDAIVWVAVKLGFGKIEVDGSLVAILVLALVSAAYAAEILSAAISAVPKGAVEAGASLGMSETTRFRRVTLPLMLPFALPGLANLWASVVKGTSLVSLVGVMEISLAAEQAAGATKAYFTFYLAAATAYLAINWFVLRLCQHLERRLRKGWASP